jgi:hypothetical protein
MGTVRGTYRAYGLETTRFRSDSGAGTDALYFESCVRCWPERLVDWERLRVVGRLPLFGPSYSAAMSVADAARRRLVAQLPWDLDTPVVAAGRTTTGARAATGPQRPLTTGKRKLGRNAPCWCGSGKKYKKCHLPLEIS